MPKRALLVEDDEEQIDFTQGVLERLGFTVAVFRSAAEARDAVPASIRPIDLAVLDRRLPTQYGEEATDEVGDALLDELLVHLPDTPFVVFSGYTGFPHAQFATRGRGVIPIGPREQSVDRVTPFDKEQSIEFSEYVGSIASRIDELDDLEADVDLPADQDLVSRRLLKRVAAHFAASSITAKPLIGGLTKASLWTCDVYGADGVNLATVVVKQSARPHSPSFGGLHTLVPAGFAAAPVAVVVGMCDGQQGQVMQLAGREAAPLMTLLTDDPVSASEYLGRVRRAICDVTSGGPVLPSTVAAICEPLTEWTALTERLDGYGLSVPRGSLVARTRRAAQHGDLHPGNVLIADGQPILIDFDSEVVGSSLLDPVTALLSPLFHADSALRQGAWPTPSQCGTLGSEAFFQGAPYEGWMRVAWDWALDMRGSDRELWSVVLAYVGRQLKYPDVIADDIAVARACTFAATAIARLEGS